MELNQAKWIGVGEGYGDICPEFGKTFVIKSRVVKAELVVTAIGVYEAHLNGKRVGNFVLAPGCTVYRERLQVQSYDVGKLLQEENELLVTVGTGWHRGRISADSEDINRMPCALIARLSLEYEDGSVQELLTDESWRVRKSRILFSDLYDGEIYDASLQERPWESVVVHEELKKDRLIPQEGEIISEHERIKPCRYFETPRGERVIDFGQNFAGYVEISLNAKAGERVALSVAETLDDSGNVYTENYRTAKARLIYICKDGRQSYKPHHTFYGFRYLWLDEYPQTVSLDSFTGIAIYSDMKRTGYMESGNAQLNRLYENTLWSQRSNFIDIPTDCPQRDERMGWTGDAQVFSSTAAFHYDVKKFFQKWLRDVRAEQFENGMICDVVPNYWKLGRGSAAWGDVIAVMPWNAYLAYGEKDILEENFDAMKKWVDYMGEDSLDPDLWTCKQEEKKLWGKHYGDWLAQDAPYGSYYGSTEVDLIASAFYACSTSLLIKAGEVLGKDMTAYRDRYKRIVAAYKKRFSKPDTQTAHVLALQFGLTDEKEKVAAELAQMIRDNGNKLMTGFVGTPYLLFALSDNGYIETAYDLLFQEEQPSWFYEVNHGATTIWEHWDGVRDDGTIWSSDMNSYNHYAYGSVMNWVYTVSAGIRPDERHPGYEQVVIAPKPDRRLGWLRAELETQHGRICSAWVCEDEKIRYEIHTPVPALITIGAEESRVEPGEYIFYSPLN